MEKKNPFPDPDFRGVYHLDDGSQIFPFPENPVFWGARRGDGPPLYDKYGCVRWFDSIESAALALQEDRREYKKPFFCSKTRDEHMISVTADPDGSQVDVYLARRGIDPGDPDYFLSAELSFATPYMVSNIFGLRSEQLREMAEMFLKFADVLETPEKEDPPEISSSGGSGENNPIPSPLPSPFRGRLEYDLRVSDRSPVVKGTWVTVSHILSLITEGWTWTNILRVHPELTEDDLRICFAYAVSISQE